MVQESESGAETPEPLVSAVRVMDREFKRWELGQDDEMSPALLSAIGVVCGIVTTGFPNNNELLGLFVACTRLAVEYQAVLNEEGSGNRLISAIQDCVKFLDLVEVETTPPVRPVSSFLAQYKDSPHKYRWIAVEFGTFDQEKEQWTGPFFNRNGVPQESLIEKEAANPGSVLGVDYKPVSAVQKAERVRAQALKQLAQLQSGLFRPEGGAKPEKASIQEMLEDGQYPDVIARVKGVSLAEVLAVAHEQGLIPKNREIDLAAAALATLGNPMDEARGYVAPKLDHAPDPDFDDLPDDQPIDVDVTDDDVADDSVENLEYVEPAKLTKEELEAFALAHLAEDNEATAQDILIAVAEQTGRSASRQMLAPILKSLRG